MQLEQIWWRRVTAADFHSIEKQPPAGAKGQQHIDVPDGPALRSSPIPRLDPCSARRVPTNTPLLSKPATSAMQEVLTWGSSEPHAVA